MLCFEYEYGASQNRVVVEQAEREEGEAPPLY
jgi:hypothetical protein